ncbi:MAG: cyclic nucleotide-binding domain-containing protein [Candidatus Gracilibacteria bacterium]|jgi:CRP-like cAMP-binding protein|nr:cyclic nucleotide-binding domain-containing protein [Candidatus Gracilibacteria bacterium]
MPINEADIKILLPILHKIPLFQGLNEQEHRDILERIILMYYPKDYELFAEGEMGDALYIIKTGAVEIFHPAINEDEEPKKVAQINDNGFFGEMALVTEEKRNASAKTLLDSEIFILSRDDFKKLLDSNQTMAEQISATVVKRTDENFTNK